MKYKTITRGLKRDCRHARFNVSQVSVQLTAELGEGDTLRSAADELYEDLVILVEEMVEEEKLKYKEGLREISHK